MTATKTAKKTVSDLPGLGAEKLRSAVLQRVEQGQHLALDVAERVAGAADKLVPSVVKPTITKARQVMAANVDFAFAIAKSNAEFASKFAKTLVEAR
jgi:hypothetical protein